MLRWSVSEGTNKQGEPELHDLLAESYFRQNEYGKAQRHFLRGNRPERFAEVLTSWSNQAYPSERDLFIARAVLQYVLNFINILIFKPGICVYRI